MLERILIAGSGGQGILFIGKLLANAAVDSTPFITFFPAYGAEVRGGTCNCQVILSSTEISSPIAESFDSIIIMNQQSADRFVGQLDRNGMGIINESMCTVRADKRLIGIKATDIAGKLGNSKAANILMFGILLGKKKICDSEAIKKSLEKKFAGPSNQKLLSINLKAFHLGLQGKY